MSADSLPISPARFALAVKDLPLTTLHLKAFELRNSISHLEYSNSELQPYATPPPTSTEAPDAVCAEAIAENVETIKRMQERMDLLKVEVESRGASWLEFMSKDEIVSALAEGRGMEGGNARIDGDETPSSGVGAQATDGAAVNGSRANATSASNPWADGTFQTGRIANGEVVMDQANGAAVGRAVNREVNGVNGHVSRTTNGAAQGGSIGDEEMRTRMEERMREAMGHDDGDGMHL